jgi:hypothetical protein
VVKNGGLCGSRRDHRSAGRDRGSHRHRYAGKNGPGKAERQEGGDDGSPYAHDSSMAYVQLSSLHLASAARRRIDDDVFYLPAFGSYMNYDKSLCWPSSMIKIGSDSCVFSLCEKFSQRCDKIDGS